MTHLQASLPVLLALLAPCAWSQDIGQAWDAILPRSDQPPPAPQIQPKTNPAADFAKHFFFETQTDYWRYSTNFTGLATATGIVNTPFTGTFNPTGVPYPAAFQPYSNRIYSFMDWGTRGWLSDRVNTHFAFRYAQDLTTVNQGAAAQDIVETYAANRSLQLVSGSVEVALPSATMQFGRQFVYGAELAALDGASLSINRAKFALDIFGGRRFTYDSDPDQRSIGGANVVFRLPHQASVEYSGLWYIKGTHSLAYRKRFGSGWLFTTYFRAYGGAPVDFNAQAMYSSPNGKTTVRFSYFQKLTDRDYFYDFTYLPQMRLNLGPIEPYSQFNINAHRSVTNRLRVAASIWIRRLNDSSNQGPFDTSFEDYRFNGQILAVRKTEVFFEYHQRDSDRMSPLNSSAFDDIHASGETSVQDLSAELRRSFGEGRLRISGGAYYRRISLQDQFTIVNGMHQSGWLASAVCRLDKRSRLFADYNLDNDFFLFRPSIANSRILRLGVAWKY